MNTSRMALFCALVGWMAADAQAQLGTYGSPDLIPLGQYTPQYYPAQAMVNRASNTIVADRSGPTLAPPSANIPQPPGAYGSVGQQLPGPSVIPAPPPSESSAVSSMLSEPNPTVSPSSGCGCNVLPSGGYFKNAGNGETAGDACGGCGGCGCCGNGCCSPWYASADALCMTRNTPNKVYTSAEASSQVNQGYFDDVNWTWGGQGTIGYRFGCCCEWGVEGTYWSLAESSTDGGPGIPGPYVTPMIFRLTDILGTTGGGGTNGCQTANAYTDGSPYHHIWLDWITQNLEVNGVRKVCTGPCSPVDVDFLFGVRWFRFEDGFLFGAERASDGSPYANDWLYLNDHITNDLVGFQTGFNASYRFADCWRAFLIPKFGIYDNHMCLDYNLYAVSSTSGAIYQGSSSTYPNQNYPVHTTADGFSFLTQVDLGLEWQICRHVGAQLGYRVVAVTGMALSGSQVPFYGNDTQAISDIKHSDSLILHGALGGLTFTW